MALIKNINYLIGGLLIFLFIVTTAFAGNLSSSSAYTYGYVYGNFYPIDFIIEHFPKLMPQAQFAKNHFLNSPYGEGYLELEKNIYLESKDEIEKFKAIIKPDLEEVFKPDRAIENAKLIINAVENMAQGRMNIEYRRELLSFNKNFSNNNEFEMKSNFIQTIRSKDYPYLGKADFEFQIPQSWNYKQINRMNLWH